MYLTPTLTPTPDPSPNPDQVLLERYVRVRAERLAPYIAALAANVSARGVPTMRPLWWEFPNDAAAVGARLMYSKP